MYPQIPVIRNKDYTVYIEPHLNALWLHCKVSSFNLTVLKSMIKEWEEFTQALKQDLYVARDVENNLPSIHFINKFGFTFLKDIKSKDNKHYEIWKRGK